MEPHPLSNYRVMLITFLCMLGSLLSMIGAASTFRFILPAYYGWDDYSRTLFLSFLTYNWLLLASSRLLEHTPFKPFAISDPNRILFYALPSGIALGAFASLLLNAPALSIPKAAFYWKYMLPAMHAFNSEVLFRLFFLPLVFIVLQKVCGTKSPWTLWASIIITALLLFSPSYKGAV